MDPTCDCLNVRTFWLQWVSVSGAVTAPVSKDNLKMRQQLQNYKENT